MTHYVVINEWADDENCAYGVNVVGVAHTLDEAKEIFNGKIADERQYADENGYEIYEDNEEVFDAGETGYYNRNHTKLYIQEVD